jgi:hypothetical protein
MKLGDLAALAIIGGFVLHWLEYRRREQERRQQEQDLWPPA